MNLSYRIYYVWKRNLLSFKRFLIPTLLVSMGEPFFYLVTFGIGLGAYIGLIGGKPYLNFLVPGVLISSAAIASTYECLYGTFVRMVHENIFDAMIVTPISAEDIVAGEIVWGLTRGLLSAFILAIFATLLGVFPFSPLGLVLLLMLMVAVGFWFASLAMIVTAFAPNFDFFNYYSELVVTPMLFFSGVFFPMDNFPGWVKVIAQFLPMTHGVALSRALVSGQYSTGLVFNLLVILIGAGVSFYLALLFMKRRLIK